jgi:hypothetical protein
MAKLQVPVQLGMPFHRIVTRPSSALTVHGRAGMANAALLGFTTTSFDTAETFGGKAPSSARIT